jgi:hypothetical protein
LGEGAHSLQRSCCASPCQELRRASYELLIKLYSHHPLLRVPPGAPPGGPPGGSPGAASMGAAGPTDALSLRHSVRCALLRGLDHPCTPVRRLRKLRFVCGTSEGAGSYKVGSVASSAVSGKEKRKECVGRCSWTDFGGSTRVSWKRRVGPCELLAPRRSPLFLIPVFFLLVLPGCRGRWRSAVWVRAWGRGSNGDAERCRRRRRVRRPRRL